MSLTATRLSLHALAEQVISPLRVQATGNEIALTVRPGGFGTYDLPQGGYAAVDADGVVLVPPSGPARRAPFTSLRDAGTLVGLTTAATLPTDELAIDPDDVRTLGALFAQAQADLEALAAEATPDDAVSEIHLWPEHFDLALELGSEKLGQRATYGVSPGDERHDAPYAYIAPWVAPPAGPLWQASGFTGAELPVERMGEVLGFWRERRDALRA